MSRRQDARDEVLAIIEQSRLTQAKRDGWDAGYAKAMLGEGGLAFGTYPVKVTIEWPEGPPPPELLAILWAKAELRP